jgi:hypothetical protein
MTLLVEDPGVVKKLSIVGLLELIEEGLERVVEYRCLKSTAEWKLALVLTELRLDICVIEPASEFHMETSDSPVNRCRSTFSSSCT